MKQRWDFFKESDSSFGVFYPMHYVVAGFDTDAHAEAAAAAFREAGFAADDVATLPGNDLVNRVESQHDANWLDRLMASVSHVVGTEAGFIEDDLKLARRGGAFVFVYAPKHEGAERASAVLRRQHPVFARRYHEAGVVKLAYPPRSTL